MGSALELSNGGRSWLVRGGCVDWRENKYELRLRAAIVEQRELRLLIAIVELMSFAYELLL